MLRPDKIPYQTEVTATGGRDGKAASDDAAASCDDAKVETSPEIRNQTVLPLLSYLNLDEGGGSRPRRTCPQKSWNTSDSYTCAAQSALLLQFRHSNVKATR